MDKQKALEITKERIDGITKCSYETVSKNQIAQEMLEYLIFIERL